MFKEISKQFQFPCHPSLILSYNSGTEGQRSLMFYLKYNAIKKAVLSINPTAMASPHSHSEVQSMQCTSWQKGNPRREVSFHSIPIPLGITKLKRNKQTSNAWEISTLH